MLNKLIRFSTQNPYYILLGVVALMALGIYNAWQLNLDAVPDITNNQVQVVTTSQALAPQEMEQLVTYPLELKCTNIPGVEEMRSITRFGLSVITIVFNPSVPLLDARQLVREQIENAKADLPPYVKPPELMPMTTGLGEVYQYVLTVDSAHQGQYSPMDLRTIQDWIVKRRLAGIPGIVEISSFGGYLKQYEVAIDPQKAHNMGISLSQIVTALQQANQNSGGSYIEKNDKAWYIRTEGMLKNLDEIKKIVISVHHGRPVLIADVARVQFGWPKRYGALTINGQGETVGGITLMQKGRNALKVTRAVEKRVAEIQNNLPAGVKIQPYLSRSSLVQRAVSTVINNLTEGALIVAVVLLLLLGNWRAGLVITSVVPVSMLMAISAMHYTGVSANLMSLGAIDFGIIVDGSVIVIENLMAALAIGFAGQRLSKQQMQNQVAKSTTEIYTAAAFGVLIIFVVFIPVLSLQGVEGKTFRPMALTLMYLLGSSLVLTLTWIPALATLLLSKKISDKLSLSERATHWLETKYKKSLGKVINHHWVVIGIAVIGLGVSVWRFSTLGSEFLPKLEEGDLAMQMTLPTGSSLSKSIEVTTQAEKILLSEFAQVANIVSKIGTAEVPTDPMAIETADIMVTLKPADQWPVPMSQDQLANQMKKALNQIPNASFDFSQPIQLRFNELLTGAKTDVAIKIFGNNLEKLASLAQRAAFLIKDVKGAADIKPEQSDGLPQLQITYNRAAMAQYGVAITHVNQTIEAAYAGMRTGFILNDEKKFDVVARLDGNHRTMAGLQHLKIPTYTGYLLPLSQFCNINLQQGPAQISRDDSRRRVVVGVNVRGRDLESVVNDMKKILDNKLELPAGYYIKYEGDFKNLQQARARLLFAVPLALVLILLLLFMAFGKINYALLVFSGVPLSAIGGIWALWLRGMDFSISAAIGFIALFGVSVLNGIVLVSHLKNLSENKTNSNNNQFIINGAAQRLRPVITTALVAALGFFPMAFSTQAGAEVQKPLATVVIGGLISSTLLTLVVLPILFKLFQKIKMPTKIITVALFLIILPTLPLQAQQTLQQATNHALQNHPEIAWLQQQQDMVAQGGKNLIWKVPQTNFSGQYGNLDGTMVDWSLNVSQPLGNIYERHTTQKAQLAKAAFVNAEIYLLKKQLIRDLTISWIAYQLATKKVEIATQNAQMADTLLQITEKGKQVGYSTQQDVYMAQMYAQSQYLELTTQKQQLSQSKAMFLKTAFLQPETQIKMVGDTIWQWPSQTNTPDTNLIQPYHNYLKTEQLQLKVIKAQKAPSVSIGAFRQQISGISGLHGVTAGIALPILPSSIKNQQQQQHIIVNQAKLKLQQATNNFNNNYQDVLNQALQWKIALENQNYQKTLSNNPAQRMVKSLKAGKISVQEFIFAQNQINNFKMITLDAIEKYNTSVQKLVFFLTPTPTNE